MVIHTGQGIPANLHHVYKHAKPIANRVKACPFTVRPLHRHFDGLEAHAAAKEEDFRIESPTFDFLEGEDSLRGFAFESLESALRVFEVQAEDEAQQEIEDAAEELAVQGLALGLQLGAKPA